MKVPFPFASLVPLRLGFPLHGSVKIPVVSLGATLVDAVAAAASIVKFRLGGLRGSLLTVSSAEQGSRFAFG